MKSSMCFEPRMKNHDAKPIPFKRYEFKCKLTLGLLMALKVLSERRFTNQYSCGQNF